MKETNTGLKIKKIHKIRIEVESKKLKEYPVFSVPIGVKIQSGFIPKKRIEINKWFNKFTIQ